MPIWMIVLLILLVLGLIYLFFFGWSLPTKTKTVYVQGRPYVQKEWIDKAEPDAGEILA